MKKWAINISLQTFGFPPCAYTKKSNVLAMTLECLVRPFWNSTVCAGDYFILRRACINGKPFTTKTSPRFSILTKRIDCQEAVANK